MHAMFCRVIALMQQFGRTISVTFLLLRGASAARIGMGHPSTCKTLQAMSALGGHCMPVVERGVLRVGLLVYCTLQGQNLVLVRW